MSSRTIDMGVYVVISLEDEQTVDIIRRTPHFHYSVKFKSPGDYTRFIECLDNSFHHPDDEAAPIITVEKLIERAKVEWNEIEMIC